MVNMKRYKALDVCITNVFDHIFLHQIRTCLVVGVNSLIIDEVSFTKHIFLVPVLDSRTREHVNRIRPFDDQHRF